jgi:hypothetical protein
MPEDKEPKTVDIDTSGPGADVELPEEKVTENVEVQNETVQDSPKSDDTSEKSDVKSDVQESKQEEKQETSDEKQETKTEEKPKEELEQYSEGVQKRIAKLTKKWREAERQKEAALDYAKGVQTEHKTLQTKMAKLEPSYVTAVENRVKSGLEAAKSTLMRAREAGDINAEVEAQKEIARLGMEEVRVNTLKNKLSEQKETEVKTPSLDQRLQTPPADPKAEEWAEKNEWFGKDSAMTYTAFDLHKKLVDEQGYDPKTDEYYAAIDKQMRLDFPHKFAKTNSQESTKPTQTVASATRSVKPGRNTVRLTSSQVAIAKKLNVPLEEYAKQLKITKEA